MTLNLQVSNCVKKSISVYTNCTLEQAADRAEVVIMDLN